MCSLSFSVQNQDGVFTTEVKRNGGCTAFFGLYSVGCLHYQSAPPPESFLLHPRLSNMQCLHSDLKCNGQHYNETMKRYVQNQRICRSVFKILRGRMSAIESIFMFTCLFQEINIISEVYFNVVKL